MPSEDKNVLNRRFSPRIDFDEEKHIYTADGVIVPSVTEILAPLHRSYGKVNQNVLDYAAMRGRAAHEACEEIDYGLEPEVYPEIEGYISAYVDWLNLYNPVWTGVEKIVFCREGWYAGTLDRMGYIDDDLVIVDLKTSTPNREAYVSVCLQTMAYAMAANSEDISLDFQKIKRYGLFLMKDGKYRLIDCKEWEGTNHIDALEAFSLLLKTHKAVSKLLETKKGKKDDSESM